MVQNIFIHPSNRGTRGPDCQGEESLAFRRKKGDRAPGCMSSKPGTGKKARTNYQQESTNRGQDTAGVAGQKEKASQQVGDLGKGTCTINRPDDTDNIGRLSAPFKVEGTQRVGERG